MHSRDIKVINGRNKPDIWYQFQLAGYPPYFTIRFEFRSECHKIWLALNHLTFKQTIVVPHVQNALYFRRKVRAL